MIFYLSVYCQECDEEILYGPCGTTIAHNDIPVIPFDMGAQTNFECDKCGANNYTGDFELFRDGEV